MGKDISFLCSINYNSIFKIKEIINITNKDIMSFVELIPDIPKASKGHDKHLRTIYDREQLYMYGYYSQMITVLHRGGPANDYGITWGWCVK